MSNGDCEGKERERKHVTFHVAIGNLEGAIGELRCLVDNVEGKDAEAKPEPSVYVRPPVGSLATFLSDQPKRLEEMVADVRALIGRLDKLLF